MPESVIDDVGEVSFEHSEGLGLRVAVCYPPIDQLAGRWVDT